MHATQTTSSQPLSSTSPLLLSSSSPSPGLLCDDLFKPCEDPRQDGTGHEPKKIELDKNLINPQNSMIDEQDFMEEIRVEQFAAAPMNDSAYDSAESIAPDSDFDDEQIRKMLASPLYIRDREEGDGQSQAYHSGRKSLMTQSSWNPRSSGKPDAIYVQKR